MVRWIAQNGGGYDEIDVQACKERGNVHVQAQLIAFKHLHSAQE